MKIEFILIQVIVAAFLYALVFILKELSRLARQKQEGRREKGEA